MDVLLSRPLSLLFVCFLFHRVLRAIYRIYFHPLFALSRAEVDGRDKLVRILPSSRARWSLLREN
jgi:hypothetical protein